ncbi:MAG: hypothetical protein ACRBN8_36895, partial [Nannocystales bacterium]
PSAPEYALGRANTGSLVWEDRGWRVELAFEATDGPVTHCVGVFQENMRISAAGGNLRKQVLKKVKKYGDLRSPLAVGVWDRDPLSGSSQGLAGLLGTPTCVVRGDGTRVASRNRDGLLADPAARRLSAVLYCRQVNVFSDESCGVLVWLPPTAEYPLERDALPFRRTVWNRETGAATELDAEVDWDHLVR